MQSIVDDDLVSFLIRILASFILKEAIQQMVLEITIEVLITISKSAKQHKKLTLTDGS